jgi:FlaA1/EpsC-like NDP-sugar epimerase
MRILKNTAVLSAYVLLAAVALLGALLLRYDFTPPQSIAAVLLIAIPALLVTKGLVFYSVGLHRSWWHVADMADVLQLLKANIIGSAAFTLAGVLLLQTRLPRSIYVLDLLLCLLLMAGIRFHIRVVRELVQSIRGRAGRTRILIYGAGSAGMILLREIQSNPKLGMQVYGFIDDDPKKIKSVIRGVRVLGRGRDVPRVVERAGGRGIELREIVIAMPSATGREMREALANCKSAGLTCKTIPGLGELLSGKVLSAQVRNISVTDLLGRDPVQLEEALISGKLRNKSVLVTGGAGSIGSELCRQIPNFSPERLVIFDQAESDLFRIEMELRQRFPNLQLIACIGDIRDYASVREVMSRHSISVVFHAAAYKHVPMMEANVVEALANNVIGTWNLARAADRHGVETFVMISSDKAVRPTNIMGASKRAAEQVVKWIGKSAVGASYVSVRFGNVLGSNGSVVPIFQQQIAAGGPVTVTHPEMRRYFMTIPEAVQLVLQASAMGKRDEVFFLNMGEAVRITDLARNMIRLAGFEPDEDIEIRYIGTRPGEKLCEELILDSEHIQPTHHDKIKILRGTDVESSSVDAWIHELLNLLEQREENVLISHLAEFVPEYQPARSLPRREAVQAVGA